MSALAAAGIGMSIAAQHCCSGILPFSCKGASMNRLLTALFCGGLLLGTGAGFAADQNPQHRDAHDQTQPNASKGTPGETDAKTPANEHRPGVESKNENPASPRDPNSVYSTELKKCDSLQGTEKQKCVAAAKKKSGEM